jgi:predicted acylesterase/phospholipase RssA
MSTAKPLPIALTISGAVALGAYEGGVLAALISGLRPLYAGDEPRVRIDVIGGASAGSITGLLAARCIAEGIDPLTVMERAWVDADGLSSMMQGAKSSPLSAASLEKVAAELVRLPGDPAAQQQASVHVTMALGSLRGLEYQIEGDHFSTNAIHASTYLDWKSMVVSPGQEVAEYSHGDSYRPGVDAPAMVDFALASGANPLGFPPRVLSRATDERGYADHGIDNFPASKAYWYTDGGTLDNEPIGRTLDIAGELDTRDDALRRLLLLIHPHPTAAPADDAWADPSRPPTWVGTLARAQRLQTTQSIYDDLRHAVKINRRLDKVNDLVGVLTAALAKLPAAERAALDAQLAPFVKATDSTGSTTADLVHDSLRHAAGLAGKRLIGIEVLSPLLLPEAQGPDAIPVADLLAGEFLVHFGGFARTALRRHDFDLGYRTALNWFEQFRPLQFHGVGDAADETAWKAAHDRYAPTRDDSLGTTKYSTLSRSEKFAFERLFAKMAWTAIAGIRHPSPQ